ncbi:MAG TPA: hypothetical protein VKK81_25170 [Candidatus Binatia bacterium]|nr:hypothetical protein [Candidatus Binatia bacterium]
MRRVLFLVAVLVCLAVSTAKAQDPVQVDPKHNKVEFENAQVRVLRFTSGPHEKSPMHEHPANIVVFLTDAHVKFTYPDGKTEERHAKAGQVVWNAPVKHESENLGDKPVEGIQIELKAKSAASQAAKIQSALDPAKVDPKDCKVEFENDQVRVLRWTEGPHNKVPMHEHPAFVAVFLTDDNARYTYPDGRTEERHRKAGETSWSAPVKHASENLSDRPIELIQIELKGKPLAAKKKTM